MDDFEKAEVSVSAELQRIKKEQTEEKAIDKIDRLEKLILSHIDCHIIKELRDRYMNILVKRYDRDSVSYGKIAYRWNVEEDYVIKLAKEHGFFI